MILSLEIVNKDTLQLIWDWLSDDDMRWLSRFQHDPLSLRQLLEYLDKDFTLTYIIYDYDEPIGYARLTHYLPKEAMLGIALIEDYRRKGVGYEILNRLTMIAHMMGKREVRACTLKDNIGARRLLDKCGFLEKGERVHNPDLIDIDYIRRLG